MGDEDEVQAVSMSGLLRGHNAAMPRAVARDGGKAPAAGGAATSCTEACTALEEVGAWPSVAWRVRTVARGRAWCCPGQLVEVVAVQVCPR